MAHTFARSSFAKIPPAARGPVSVHRSGDPRAARRFAWTAPVTFLVGENGSGKSTLLEGIAVAAGLPAVGSMAVDDDETLAAQRSSGPVAQAAWHRRRVRGFFLRAEDFFGFTKALSRECGPSCWRRLDEIDVEFADGRT